MALVVNKGKRYGRLVVVSESEKKQLPSGQTNRVFKCKCDCGVVKDYRLVHLRNNRTKSCGCLTRKLEGRGNTKIGKLYCSMRYRCTKNNFQSDRYFERGITVCSDWLESFESFESWCLSNGYVKGLEIDRRDNNKGYSPENCRFVTPKINSNNRENTVKVEWNGENIALRLLLEQLEYPNKYETVYTRLKRGWDTKKAIFDPPANNYSSRKNANGLVISGTE